MGSVAGALDEAAGAGALAIALGVGAAVVDDAALDVVSFEPDEQLANRVKTNSTELECMSINLVAVARSLPEGEEVERCLLRENRSFIGPDETFVVIVGQAQRVCAQAQALFQIVVAQARAGDAQLSEQLV